MPLNIEELRKKILDKDTKGDPFYKLYAYWLLIKANSNKIKPDIMPG